MEYVILLGLAAGTLTAISFLPQVIRTWKLKEAKDLSLMTYIILTLGVTLWLIYGIIKSDIPIIAANTVTIVLASTILFFKLKYG